MNNGPERITLAMTGASGAQYGLRLLDCLVREDREVHFLISKAAQLVMATETDVTLPPKPQMMQAFLTEYTGAAAGQIRVYGKEDWMSPVASGSGAPAAMVVVPCSTGTLSAIATGACNNLIERAADVTLEGAPSVDSGAARGAVFEHSPGEHAQAVEHGRDDFAGVARLLSSAANHRRPDRFRRGANSQSAEHSPGHAAALGRASSEQR